MIAVEEAGGFTGAALRLGMAASALSRCVRDLEDHLGVSLFERLPRGVRATRAGIAFIAAARDILVRLDVAERSAVNAGNGCEGELRIGFVWSFAARPIVDLLSLYIRAHPNVAVHTVEEGQEALFARVSRGDLDLALTATDPPPFAPLRPLGELRRLPLWIEPLCALTPATETSHHIDWRMLAEQRLICRPDDDWRRFIQHIERACGLRLHFEQHTVARESFFGLVAAGLGWTIIPESMGRFAIDGVRVIPIVEGSAALQIEAVWHPRTDNPALTRFLALARLRFMTKEVRPVRDASSQSRDRSP